jgi:LPS export ABC transporter protein LptC
MRWQKRARLAIAAFGCAFAIVVFFAIRERKPQAAVPALTRLDPSAIVETSGCVLQSITGTRKNFTVTCDRQLAYENGEVKMYRVRVEIKERQGRDFAITGAEAQANEKTRQLAFSGGVTLQSSDGFELNTAVATFDERQGIVRAPGELSFRKGAMRGTGVGMTYDQNTDVLTILDQARVRMLDAGDTTTGEFAAGIATLDRVQNFLALERAVHVLREDQTIDSDRGTARLTEDETAITAIELRGNSRVSGGSSGFDGMTARDIDIAYGTDGETIERVVLDGAATIALKGTAGAAGRRLMGEALTLTLAPDGAVTSATGRDGAQLEIPAVDGATGRHIRARALDATGEPNKGLTAARFTDDVEYREDAAAGGAARTARSRALSVALDGNAIARAVFTGTVQFEEAALKAAAAEARYEPAQGVLRLWGADEGGGPRVADERIAIEAAAIDVTLAGRKMLASGNVKTRLQSGDKTPGLLSTEQPTNVSAAALRYAGDTGQAVYTGTAQLWQGETAIRGDTIAIDQEKRNLRAAGSARATLALGEAPSIARAEEIVYDDAKRLITLTGVTPPPTPPAAAAAKPAAAPAAPKPAAPPMRGAPAPAVPPRAGAAGSVPAPLAAGSHAQMSGPEGDLRGYRIVVALREAHNEMERLEAFDDVTLRVNGRVVTGAHMIYENNGRYQMTGTAAAPVKMVESCQETTGRTLTFFKSTDNIIIDGNEEIRTRTTSGGPCPPPQEHGGRK